MNRTCKTCQEEKPVDQFYLRDKKYPFSECKKCMAAKRPKVRVQSPWDDVADDVKKAFYHDYYVQRIPLIQLAKKYEIPYPNLQYYKRRGYLKNPALQVPLVGEH